MTLPLSDFATLAEKLQQTAQALLDFSRARHVAAQDTAKAENTSPAPASDEPASAYEIRSYRIAQYLLRDERNLLEMTDADELLDVLHKAYGHLHGMPF